LETGDNHLLLNSYELTSHDNIPSPFHSYEGLRKKTELFSNSVYITGNCQVIQDYTSILNISEDVMVQIWCFYNGAQ